MRPGSILLLWLLAACPAVAQPAPGDLYREFIWLPEMVKEDGKFLRVGGKLDYATNPAHFPENRHDEGYIPLGNFIDINFATRAEVMVEKIASHDDTKGLRISINRNSFHYFPVADSIPHPQSDYMHHTNPVVPVPLNELQHGEGNEFRLEVDPEQRWDWPQHLIYSVIVRIYYHPDSLEKYTRNRLVVGRKPFDPDVKLSLAIPDEPIRQVDFLGLYTGINVEGDGKYRQWHYRFLRGRMQHHLGSTDNYPYSTHWNTEWIPDQTSNIRLAARITYHNGMIFFTPAVTSTLPERNYHVYLARPMETPKNWVTREGDQSVNIHVPVATGEMDEVRLLWTSWSPCYNQGLLINGHLTEKIEGPCYEYLDHVLPVDPALFRQGTNEITTVKEPLHDGQMVHGMEVQYPGIMMLIKTIGE